MSSAAERISAGEHHRARAQERKAELESAEQRADRIGNVRLVLALLAMVLVVLPLFLREGWPWWALLPLFFVFLALGKAHDNATERRRVAAGKLRYATEALDRLEERWRELADDGADLTAIRGRASYADDLDLFGKASLFQLLSRAVSERGRGSLATWLVSPVGGEQARARQAAVAELAAARELRERLFAAACAEDARTIREGPLLAWAEGQDPIPARALWSLAGKLAPLVLAASAVATALGAVPTVLVGAVVGQLLLAGAARRVVRARAEVLAGPEQVLLRLGRLIEVVESMPPQAPLLRALRARLCPEGQAPASQQVRRLLRLMGLLDASRNAFFALSVGLALLWDLNLILATESLRAQLGPKLRGWLEAIGELEALASLGAFADERPDYAMPQLISGPGSFRAVALAHPLIDRRVVVANDLLLGGPGSVLLLSGSNMSGKSTLLRAVGLAQVLARAGAPVAARELTLSELELCTSVRIVDSLAAGTSHFYAELKRLKEIVDAARAPGAAVLYLLDEILHGTNSRERLIGAVSVIRWLSEQGAMGIVTTHDLSLARVAERLPEGRVRNAHFSDEVAAAEIRFDYRLREGPVASTNALRLMKAVGIDVELSE